MAHMISPSLPLSLLLPLSFSHKMILLYKDPKGRTIGSTTKVASVAGNAVSQVDTTYHSDCMGEENYFIGESSAGKRRQDSLANEVPKL